MMREQLPCTMGRSDKRDTPLQFSQRWNISIPDISTHWHLIASPQRVFPSYSSLTALTGKVAIVGAKEASLSRKAATLLVSKYSHWINYMSHISDAMTLQSIGLVEYKPSQPHRYVFYHRYNSILLTLLCSIRAWCCHITPPFSTYHQPMSA